MRKVKTLVKKEIRDILRDKKTLVMMVVVPMLLYPLIIIGMSIGISMFMQSQEDQEHIVGYAQKYAEVVSRLEELYKENQEELDWQITFVPSRESSEEDREAADVWMEMKWEPGDVELETERKPGNVELETEPKSGNVETGEPLHVELLYSSAEESSLGTKRVLEDILEKYREELLLENLAKEGLDETILYPVTYEATDGASLTESFGMDIGGSIGMMLMVTILLGAVYPAIDSTAGEKERGTLETLLTLPVTNFQMILSKFISVSVFACVTAVLSVLSLGGSVLFLIFGISDTMGEQLQGISLGAVLPYIPLLLVALIATALLATALCMCFCVFAKSFKEANNYVTPVLLIVMFASMTAMIPSFRLDYKTALIPIVNVSLMVKQIISQQLQMPLAALTTVVNFGYSILIAWILAKLYDSEAILFSDGFRSFRLFQKRADIKAGTVPGIGDAVISITVVLLLMLYVGSAAAVRLGGLAGTAINQILILGVPLFAVWYMKSDIRKLFSLKRPKKHTVLGSVILYFGVYCLILLTAAVLTNLLPQSTSNLQEAFVPIVEAPFPLMLLVIAAMPAVGEEILFRGFLFGTLRERLGRPVLAIVISGLVFGAFHMSLVKLIPTFLLGVLFACIVSETGSIYMTMGLHFLNNTVSVLAMKYPEETERIAPIFVEESLSLSEMAGLLAVGAVLTVVGWRLLKRKVRV
ncbi:MAG: ABC transporter permease subunit/CPBP intramembrane protease [Lachnospiraceae bacterium]|nr:ABC transporter permease subunit/CPBP intramembrane protease [Lachnospiraceae bacterium]